MQKFNTVKYVVKAKTSSFQNGNLVSQWQIIHTFQKKSEVPEFSALRLRNDYNKSLEAGNINAHIRNTDGSIPYASDCFILNQYSGQVEDRYTAPMFEVIN